MATAVVRLGVASSPLATSKKGRCATATDPTETALPPSNHSRRARLRWRVGYGDGGEGPGRHPDGPEFQRPLGSRPKTDGVCTISSPWQRLRAVLMVVTGVPPRGLYGSRPSTSTGFWDAMPSSGSRIGRCCATCCTGCTESLSEKVTVSLRDASPSGESWRF
jgi:hypothetical protein